MNAKVVSTLMRGRLAVPDYEEAKAAEEARRNAEMEQARQEAARRNAATYVQPGNASMTQGPARTMPNPYAGYSTTHETYEGERAQREAARNVNRPSGPAKNQPLKAQPKVGRNDPCPCGSGKKYKNCHGRGQ